MLNGLFNKEFIILDGAMGTMLQNSGLKLGERPEFLNFTNPNLIKGIHEKYLQAGADIIYANTFGVNRYKLAGLSYSIDEVINSAIKNAKDAISKVSNDRNDKNIKESFVALDVGPIGELLEPSGGLKFENAYDIFKEVVIAGEKAGADLIVFETMTDLYEVKAAVLAAKENTNLPVFVTMTFEQSGRTFTGCQVESMALTLQGLGVDAVGINCSLGPVEILPLIKRLAEFTNLPIIAKPNAGLPNPETGDYNISAKQFGRMMKEYTKAGVKIMGGCCGTTDEFIKELVECLKEEKFVPTTYSGKTRFCSSTKVVEVNTVRVIGERINPTGKREFAEALARNDISYVVRQAIEQSEAGADILDINVGVPELDETTLMRDVVKAIQGVISTPLQIDSSKYEALESGLRAYNGKPILNSVSGEKESLENILPLAKKYGAAIIGLTMDESGIPKNAEQRVSIAKNILKEALKYGIPKEDVLIDCLTLTVSAQQKDCVETLKAMRIIKEELGVELILGVSNISFGLPNRELINHSFLTMAMSYGLTLPIMNPNSQNMMDAIRAHRVLVGDDVDSEVYIETYKNMVKLESINTSTNVKGDSTIKLSENIQDTLDRDKMIELSIMKGLDDNVTKLTKEALEEGEMEPLEVVNNILIPALDKVGEKYEKGEFFLPQLMRSANACCKAFDIIKSAIAMNNGESISKGKIILATVKGDIHDIGKNITKVLLENYGYEVIDLGKDVEPEVIVDIAIKEDIKLVGLSALMTTTVESIKKTISLIRESGHDCKVMVGGAVLTEEYGQKIGADYYAEDAKHSVEIAKAVFK